MTTGRPRQVERVARLLRERAPALIRGGDRLPPVRELAAEVGVSVKTLRAAQALLAEEGLLEIRHGSGVFVCERAVTRRVGIYSELDLLQPRISIYPREVVRGMREFFDAQGMQAEIYLGKGLVGGRPDQPTSRRFLDDVAAGQPDRPTCRRFLDDVAAGRLDGVVFTEVPHKEGWCKWMEGFPLPAVGTRCRCDVEVDLPGMLRMGVEALIAEGCRHLALLAWGNRADLFKRCLVSHGLEYRAHWVRSDLPPSLAGAGWQEFRELWSAYGEKPDGLLILDDVLAEDAAKAMAELRIRGGEQLKVVTHANKGGEFGFPFPATRLEVDPADKVRLLGAMMLDLLAGRTVEQPKKLVQAKVVLEDRLIRAKVLNQGGIRCI